KMAFNLSYHYPHEHNGDRIEALAKLNSDNRDQILLGDGSSEILEICADAFTGPASNGKTGLGRGSLVAADPTFEAILNDASANGAEIVKIPLTPTFSHDLPKMAA